LKFKIQNSKFKILRSPLATGIPTKSPGTNFKLELKNSKRVLNFGHLNFRFILDFILTIWDFSPRATTNGFTLIELIVALGIFSTLVIGIAGVTIQLVQAQRKAANIQTVVDNIRFGLELMSREMRTGLNFNQTTPPPLGCSGSIAGTEIRFISFNQGNAQFRVYYLKDTDGDGRGNTIMRIATPNTAILPTCAMAEPLTSEDIIVDNLSFDIFGSSPGANDGQPRITISLNLRSKDNSIRNQTSMKLQTSVTQRIRDIQ